MLQSQMVVFYWTGCLENYAASYSWLQLATEDTHSNQNWFGLSSVWIPMEFNPLD